MAHVHHYAVRAPVIAEWHANNLLSQAEQSVDNLVQTVTSLVVVTQTPGSASTPTTEGSAPTTTHTSTIVLAPGPSVKTTTSSGYNPPSRQVKPSPSTSASTSLNSFIAAPSTTLASSAIPSTLLIATTSGSLPTSTSVADAASTSLTATPQSTGMSGGAKAGLAFGIIIIIALMTAAVIFFVRRKKYTEAEEHQRIDDEKHDMRQRSQSISSHVSIRRTKTNAPRLSLRPVTQMFMLGSEKQDASAFVTNSAAAVRARTPEPKMSQETTNPFGDHAAEKISIVEPAPAAVSVPSSSASDRTLSNLSDRSNPSEGQAFPTAVAGSRRNSPPGPGPNNVHRIQLDFKPSMEDELELRAGSLVRLLHEYDDGWALCIRLDRSQQGVVPRTCISKLPVKPRPGPPPPSMRGPPPQGRSRTGSNAPGSRMAPNGPPRGPPTSGRMRSQSNAPGQQQRSQSPAFAQHPEQTRPRSNSDATASQAPQGTLPARKPVPGQAM